MKDVMVVAFKFPCVCSKTVFQEFEWLVQLVDFIPSTLEVGDTEGYIEGTIDEEDWDDVVKYCETTVAVKVDYDAIREWVDEVLSGDDE